MPHIMHAALCNVCAPRTGLPFRFAVGACIVNEDKKIVGIGYNGMPNGCSDDILPWDRVADDPLDTKCVACNALR